MMKSKILAGLLIFLYTCMCMGQNKNALSTDLPSYGSNEKVGKYLKINGINLYYEVYGEGKPLLILHGSGGSIASAKEHLGFFSERYKVIAVDSRSFGKSVDENSELTYELMASDIKGLLDELKIDSTLIWGQSDGGILGLIIAMNYPEKVNKLVAFAPNVVPDTTGIEAPIYKYIEYSAKNSTDIATRQRMNLMWKHPNVPFEKLNSINAAVLLMSGDRDFVPLAHTIEIFKNIPNSNLCILPGATHRASWEKPELFHEIVIDFFEKPFAKPNTAGADRYKLPK